MSYETAAMISNAFAAACGLAFVVVYGFYAPWRKSKMGRHVMTLCFSIMAVLVFSVVLRFFPESMEENLKIIRAAGVAFIGLLLLQRAGMVYNAQKRRMSNGDTHGS